VKHHRNTSFVSSKLPRLALVRYSSLNISHPPVAINLALFLPYVAPTYMIFWLRTVPEIAVSDPLTIPQT